ncbi:junctional adhesion molecule A-like [Mustelus asterias]
MAVNRGWQIYCRQQASKWALVLALLAKHVLVTESFSVTTDTPQVSVKEGAAADLHCQYSADFGLPRVEWKYFRADGSNWYVYYDGKITDSYKGRVDFSALALHFKKTVPADDGNYFCQVTGDGGSHAGEAKVTLVVQVPPDTPHASIPTSVTTGSEVTLRCMESVGQPPSTYKWLRNNLFMPEDPKSNQAYLNSSYTIDPKAGTLNFKSVSKSDSGEYACQAGNGVGTPKTSSPVVHMEVYDTNVGGIVAGVIVALLILAFIGIGLWFAYRKGYIGRNNKPKVIYSQPPPDEMDDGDFKQKSSFVV